MTTEEFIEIAEFFGELVRLSVRPEITEVRRGLVQVLAGRMHKLARERKKILLEELKGLEKI